MDILHGTLGLTTPGPVESLIVAGVFAATSMLCFILGLRTRHFYKKWIRVPGRVIKLGLFKAMVEWKFGGQTYSTSPTGIYAIRSGDKHEILLNPRYTTSARINVWTHNGLIWYWGGSLAGALSGLVLIYFFNVL